MELIPLMLMATGAVQVIRKSLETSARLPEWDRVLSKVWLGSAVLLAVSFLPGFGFVGDLYGEAIYVLVLITVYLLRDYRPARLLSLALLPYAAVYVFNHLIAFVAPGPEVTSTTPGRPVLRA